MPRTSQQARAKKYVESILKKIDFDTSKASDDQSFILESHEELAKDLIDAHKKALAQQAKGDRMAKAKSTACLGTRARAGAEEDAEAEKLAHDREDDSKSTTSLGILRVREFKENPDKYIQLIPDLPKGTEIAIIQAGPYRSQWIRVRSDKVSCDDLKCWMETAEDLGEGAVYVCIPQAILRKDLMTVILAGGYKFYTHNYDTDEMIWYAWTRRDMACRVPKYATSIEGGGGIVLSPNETEILMVKEYGCYGRAGGAVDLGESCLDAAVREIKEETGVGLDESFTPLLGVGYQQPASRDGIINDHFLLFVVKAKSKELKIDFTEIQGAKWFKLDIIANAWQKFSSEWKCSKGEEAYPSTIEIDGEMFGVLELIASHRFHNKLTRPIIRSKGPRKQPKVMF